MPANRRGSVQHFRAAPAPARAMTAVAVLLAFTVAWTSTACRRGERHVTDEATVPNLSAVSPEHELVRVPAGSFLFGCEPSRDPSCTQDEQPATTVELPAFEIDRTEVTQAAYQRCIDAGRCTRPSASFAPEHRPQHAVTSVDWSQANAYCAWRGARLPTEAEWEKAARGSDGRIFPWGNDPATCELADYARCDRPRAPVGSFPKGRSPSGALDMAGGVDEWVADEYVARRGQPAGSAPRQRVARGGAYDPWHIRSTARSALAPGHHAEDLGFRCAR
jgi:formylglycine-generating enzyme required for sulfatase activity